jgi:hypothetical protein
MLVLALFGVKFVLLWGVLTFVAKFLPTDLKQIGDGIGPCQREQVLIHAVGQPAQRCYNEDEIVIAR